MRYLIKKLHYKNSYVILFSLLWPFYKLVLFDELNFIFKRGISPDLRRTLTGWCITLPAHGIPLIGIKVSYPADEMVDTFLCYYLTASKIPYSHSPFFIALYWLNNASVGYGFKGMNESMIWRGRKRNET